LSFVEDKSDGSEKYLRDRLRWRGGKKKTGSHALTLWDTSSDLLVLVLILNPQYQQQQGPHILKICQAMAVFENSSSTVARQKYSARFCNSLNAMNYFWHDLEILGHLRYFFSVHIKIISFLESVV